MNRTQQILSDAAKLIPNEQHWLRPGNSGHRGWWDTDCFCPLTAINFVSLTGTERARICFMQAIGREGVPFYTIAEWNDEPERTLAEVHEAFVKAQQLAQAIA